MNEGTKTGLFWLGSLIVAAIAVFVSLPPSNEEQDALSINKPLFEDFTDPLAAASLKIVTYNETLGELESFEVAKDRQSGLWSIPSRQGYPADAADQMQKAATTLLDVRILDVVSVNAEVHEEFGVLEPILDKLRVGDTGVGRLVTVKDQDGGPLASLVIGNEVQGEPGNRYVRVPSQDPVYKVKLDESPLTTKFSDWIEDDLLQLSSFDIAGTKIRNYSAALSGGLQQLSIEMEKEYDANLSLDDKNQWQLDSLVVYDEENSGQVKSLSADEELNAQALNSMKNALDDLKIVDVIRKPEGMSSDLKADKSLVENNQSLQSLVTRGFYPVTGSGEGGLDVLAANGEMTVDLKDGVQYVLRFGSIAGLSEESNENADDGNGDAEGADEEAANSVTGSNRYLLVTTRVNEAMVPQPELKVIPQTYEELQAMLNPQPAFEDAQLNPLADDVAPVPKSDETPATDPKPEGTEGAENTEGSDDKPEDSPAPSEDKPADDTSEGPTVVQPNNDGASGNEDAPAPDSEQAGTVEASGEGATNVVGEGSGSGSGQDGDISQEPANETPVPPATEPQDGADSASELNPPANSDQPTSDELTEQEKGELLVAEQEKIMKENERMREQRREKVNNAKQRVRELNARFADWYYIVPESTYRDLQVKLDALIKNKSDAAPSNPASPAMPQFQFPGN